MFYFYLLLKKKKINKLIRLPSILIFYSRRSLEEETIKKEKEISLGDTRARSEIINRAEEKSKRSRDGAVRFYFGKRPGAVSED